MHLTVSEGIGAQVAAAGAPDLRGAAPGGAVLPRPIAFVSTVDERGRPNLAPFSFITGLTVKPLTVGFCPLRRFNDGADEAGAGSLVSGEVLRLHVADDLFADGRIDTGRLQPVGRLAGSEYTTLGRRFSLERGR